MDDQVDISGTAVDYTAGDALHDGTLYRAGDAQHVIFLPDWEGCCSAYAHRKAQWLAKQLQGTVLLTDLYGKGAKPPDYAGHADRFIEQSLGNPPQLRQRLAQLATAASGVLDAPLERISAVGVCFGGSLAFELGRAELGLAAVVSIHGTPSSSHPLSQSRHPTPFLLIHGAVDPLISMQSVNAFAQEMTSAGTDWQMLMLGNALHSFTKEEIGHHGFSSRYDPVANQRALAYTAAFIEEQRDD
jgi:dienelactone hydrolase